MSVSGKSAASPDGHYYRGRAEDELAAAQDARHPEAAKAHYVLAGLYLDRVHNADAQQAEQATVAHRDAD